MRDSRVVFVAALLVAFACTVPSKAVEPAQAILESAGIEGGLVVHLHCGNGDLTAGLCAGDRYLVQGLDSDAENVERARRHVRSLGLYGKVTADVFDGAALPYIDNLVNLLVAEDLGKVSRDEVFRVLCPGGVACLKQDGQWTTTVKPWPEEIDEWTHWLHGPDNNAVSSDKRVGVSRSLQWIMPPLWARHHNLLPSVSAMVSAGGRVYYIVDEGAVGVRGLTDKWHLVARDAFNGLPLWKRPIRNWGWRTWSEVEFSGVMRFKGPDQLYRRLIAVDDVVYVTLGFDQPVVAIDGATGKTIRQYPATNDASEILYHRGLLLLAKNVLGDRPGKTIFAVDAQNGEILWENTGYEGTTAHNDELERFTDAYLTVGENMAFLIDGDDVVGLELTTGKEAWRRPRPPMEKNVAGHYQFNHANLCTLVFHDGILLLGQMFPFADNLNSRQQKTMVLLAMDADSGEKLWESTGMSLAHFTPPDVFVAAGLVWTLKEKEVSLLGLDLQTGEVKRRYPVKDMLVGHHHRCYRNKATERFYLAGEEGIEYIDFKTGELDVHHWIRGVCGYGIMPANGCIYLPTHSCGCHNNAKLNGFIALTAGPVPEASLKTEDRLQKGPAFSHVLNGRPASAEDWPVFKRDNRRSNHARTSVPAELSLQWVRSLGRRLTPPVVADDRLYVAAQDAHQLNCLDAKTGETRWQLTTDGTVDTPPTFHKGRLIFGTRTGFVCALKAEDGQLIWRFRAAPADSRLTAFGRLESPWPVHGSVLVMDDRVYCVAGRSMHLNSGLYLYELDAGTGEILQRARMTADTRVKGEVKGAVLPDVLVSDGSSVTMRTMQFSPEDISEHHFRREGAFLAANDGGLLDDTWFNSAFWTYLKSRAQMMVFDEERAYGIAAYEKFVTKSYPHDVFTPGSGYRLFSAELGAGSPGTSDRRGKPARGKSTPAVHWEKRVGVRGQAMVVTGEHLYLAGAPDVVDANDPWAAWEGRKGGVLQVFSKDDGQRRSECRLTSIPTYDGMAAARGRLYLSLQDGSLVCFGRQKSPDVD
ncbi:MAG: outer membrane protein assembly factor BamB family protein [Planctomycetota bacterium]|jgi:outer membrane protein assembly factor BamB